MTKLNLIYAVKDKEGGSGLIANVMADAFPSLFNSQCFPDVPKENRYWILHNPNKYNYPRTLRAFDFCATRVEYANSIISKKKMTNGWSYYKKYKNIFWSMLPTYIVNTYTCSKTIGVGYYARQCRYDSNKAFVDFANSLPAGLPVVTMGDKNLLLGLTSLNWYHTYDPIKFFSKCSHYFYWKSSIFEDPLPHTLLEAVQAGCRIIVPDNPSRKHEDGIDDILSFIDYDKTFIESSTGKHEDSLDNSNWEHWLTKHVGILKDSRINPIEINTKYKCMADWYYKEVIG